jgi:prepilin-type N-terminal cleavage/methylation domain-containing protein
VQRPAAISVWRVDRGRRRRRGFTLLETLLVLALVVAFAALCWPALEGSIDGARLRSAADRVRTACDHARLSAMTEGAIYVLRFQAGSDQYQVEPWELVANDRADVGAATGTDAGTRAAGDDAAVVPSRAIPVDCSVAGLPIAGRLPAGVCFGTAEHRDETGARGTDAELQGQLDSNLVLFYPDGTTSEVSFSLSSERQWHVVVSLRGVTGASTVSELLTADELAW